MKIESFAKHQEVSTDSFVVDYTQQTSSKRKVEIIHEVPMDIAYFHLQNPRNIYYWAINLEENPSVLKGSDQCECIFASSRATSKGWVCLVELKYCLEKNIEGNSEHALEQLCETMNKLIELDIIAHNRHRIFLNISVPEHSNREPFTSFQGLQEDRLKLLETHRVKLLGYNQVLVLNEGFIKVPKSEI